jgi:hypothetical protein
VKKAAAGSAERLRDFDAHDAKLEELIHQSARDLCVLVHLAHEGFYMRVGECPDTFPEQSLVFGKDRQRARCFSRFMRHN